MTATLDDAIYNLDLAAEEVPGRPGVRTVLCSQAQIELEPTALTLETCSIKATAPDGRHRLFLNGPTPGITTLVASGSDYALPRAHAQLMKSSADRGLEPTSARIDARMTIGHVSIEIAAAADVELERGPVGVGVELGRRLDSLCDRFLTAAVATALGAAIGETVEVIWDPLPNVRNTQLKLGETP